MWSWAELRPHEPVKTAHKILTIRAFAARSREQDVKGDHPNLTQTSIRSHEG